MFALLLGYSLIGRTVPPLQRAGPVLAAGLRDLPLILRVGLPIGGAVVMETGLFAISTLFMGLIGTAQLAAHQVSLQLASIAFMVPLGLSQAATIRIGLAAGAGDMAARGCRAGSPAAWAPAFMAAMAVLFWTARAPLAGLFLDPATPEGAAAWVTPSCSCASPPCSSSSMGCR